MFCSRLTSRFLVFVLAACTSTPPAQNSADPIAQGFIEYPFVDETKTIGRDQGPESFVIRSQVGNREYSVEIPDAARDYDVEIPLAAMESEKSVGGSVGIGSSERINAASTDREMVANLPQLDAMKPTDSALMDGAFGVGKPDGPSQSPSYVLGIAKINELFRQRNFEFALIEINNLIAFYPNSPQLFKMKGTVLSKMNQLVLAESAWLKALQLTPNDVPLRRAIDRLQKMIITRQQMNPNQQSEFAIPEPVGKVNANPTSPLLK
jgi:tetratricopeptide (TPR) repeat protein